MCRRFSFDHSHDRCHSLQLALISRFFINLRETGHGMNDADRDSTDKQDLVFKAATSPEFGRVPDIWTVTAGPSREVELDPCSPSSESSGSSSLPSPQAHEILEVSRSIVRTSIQLWMAVLNSRRRRFDCRCSIWNGRDRGVVTIEVSLSTSRNCQVAWNILGASLCLVSPLSCCSPLYKHNHAGPHSSMRVLLPRL